MLTINDKKNIFRLFFSNKQSVRSISKKIGRNRRSVQKILDQFKRIIKDLNIDEKDILLKETEIVRPDVYKVGNRKKTKVTDDIFRFIEQEVKWGMLSKSKYKKGNITKLYLENREDIFEGISYSTIYHLFREMTK